MVARSNTQLAQIACSARANQFLIRRHWSRHPIHIPPLRSQKNDERKYHHRPPASDCLFYPPRSAFHRAISCLSIWWIRYSLFIQQNDAACGGEERRHGEASMSLHSKIVLAKYDVNSHFDSSAMGQSLMNHLQVNYFNYFSIKRKISQLRRTSVWDFRALAFPCERNQSHDLAIKELRHSAVSIVLPQLSILCHLNPPIGVESMMRKITPRYWICSDFPSQRGRGGKRKNLLLTITLLQALHQIELLPEIYGHAPVRVRN